MRLNLFRREQIVCEQLEPRKIIPPYEVPREVWLKHLIESYRRTSEQIEMLSDYTKSLEESFRQLLNENQELKKRYNFINEYMVHINESGASEFELRFENRQLKIKINKLEQFIKGFAPDKGRIYKDYKTAIRGQYYYIHYLKTVLHLNKVDYKKKLSFNTLEFDNIDDLINEVVNEKM